MAFVLDPTLSSPDYSSLKASVIDTVSKMSLNGSCFRVALLVGEDIRLSFKDNIDEEKDIILARMEVRGVQTTSDVFRLSKTLELFRERLFRSQEASRSTAIPLVVFLVSNPFSPFDYQSSKSEAYKAKLRGIFLSALVLNDSTTYTQLQAIVSRPLDVSAQFKRHVEVTDVSQDIVGIITHVVTVQPGPIAKTTTTSNSIATTSSTKATTTAKHVAMTSREAAPSPTTQEPWSTGGMVTAHTGRSTDKESVDVILISCKLDINIYILCY